MDFVFTEFDMSNLIVSERLCTLYATGMSKGSVTDLIPNAGY